MRQPTLSYDGRGINGPDEYRTRLATFTSREQADKWGPLFAAAPDLLEALRYIVAWDGDDWNACQARDMALRAIAKATGEEAAR